MKPIYPYAFLGALFAVGALNAATTTPVGYVTKALPANSYSFIGITLHNSVVSSGVLTGESASSVTADADFGSLLTSGNVYILELEDGTIQEITSWTGGTLNTPEDISGKVSPNTTSYKLRKAATISDIFGATNSAGITEDDDGDYTTGNDLIFVPQAGGAVKTVYYYNDGDTAGWFDADGNDAGDLALVYADGFYLRRVAGDPVNLVISGEVKTAPTSGVLASSWNYLSSVAPVGLTVGSSGLENFVTPDAEGNYLAVDNIYIPQPGGTFKIVYYFNDGDTVGWFDADGNEADDVALEGDFLILNRGAAKPYTLSVPAAYATL